MLRRLFVTPRDPAARSLAGKLSLFAILGWMALGPLIAWFGNPPGMYVVVTVVGWDLALTAALAALFSRLPAFLLISLGLLAYGMVLWAAQFLLGFTILLMLGLGLALWLYWRDQAARTTV